MILRAVGAALAATMLTAAAPQAPAPVSVTALPGWAADDHAAAFRAFRASCGAALDPKMAQACLAAQASPPLDEAKARAFFEARFEARPPSGEGVLTAYFAPEYEARRKPEGDFTAPLRPRPKTAAATGADRTTIEARDTGDALAWLKPEDLFFLQVQGSGVLTFESGRKMKALFAATNGQRYVAIGGPMRRQGLLSSEVSAQAIHAWLAAHRGAEASAIMQLDPRYTFFRLVKDDGRPPSGSAHAPLTAGRALAVDPAYHAMGELFWVDADRPMLVGAKASYRRLALSLDTGGAIKGPARADLYLGEGAAAGAEAGRVRHRLRLWRLVPR